MLGEKNPARVVRRLATSPVAAAHARRRDKMHEGGSVARAAHVGRSTCSQGHPGRRHLVRLLRPSRASARRLRRLSRHHLSFIGSGRRADQFALALPSHGAAVANHDSFGRLSYGVARGETCVPLASATDPLRPSAGRALPHATTSDAPCRRDGAHPSSPAQARLHAGPALAGTTRHHHPARTSGLLRLFKANELVGPGRLPSARFLDLVDRGRHALAHVQLARARPAPFCTSPRVRSSSRKRPPLRAPPARLASPLGSTRFDGEDASHRLLQPTLDMCTLWTARFPCFAALAAPTEDLGYPTGRDRRGALPTASDRLATIRPRVSPCLTARAQLRPPRSSAFLWRRPGFVTGRRPRVRGVLVHGRVRSSEPVTPPSPLAAPPTLVDPLARSRDRFRRPRVNAVGVPGRGAFHRRMPRNSLARSRCPPPSPRLSPRFGFRRRFARPLSRARLGPPRHRGRLARGRRGPAPLVDFCNPDAIHEHDLVIVQTPPTTAAVACRSSGRASEPARGVKPFDLTPPWRVAADLSVGRRSPAPPRKSVARADAPPRRSQPRRTDPGASSGEPNSAPPIAIARGGRVSP